MTHDDPAILARAATAVLARARPFRGHLLVGTRPDYLTVMVGSGFDRAHRVVYRAKVAPLTPDRPWVLHRCVGRKNCIEPTHLYAGTAKDNGRDTAAAGRSRRGERHPGARLTARQVRRARAARRRGVRVSEIARRLGVTYSTVWAAVAGRNWGWLS
jgi:hypothetical protein